MQVSTDVDEVAAGVDNPTPTLILTGRVESGCYRVINTDMVIEGKLNVIPTIHTTILSFPIGKLFPIPNKKDVPAILLASFYIFNIVYPKDLYPFYTLLDNIIMHSKIVKPPMKLSSFLVDFK